MRQLDENPYVKARRDSRTTAQFAEDITVFHRKEAIYMHAWALKELRARGKVCYYEDHGVDNSGRIIIGRLGNDNADFLVHRLFPDPTKMDVKANTEKPKFMTFKHGNLESMLTQKAMILVPTTEGWHLLDQTAIRTIMETCRPRKDHSGFGGELAHRAGQGTHPEALKAAEKARLLPEEIGLVDRLVEQGHIIAREWTPPAQAVIDANREELLKRPKHRR